MKTIWKRLWNSPLATTWAATAAQLASLMLTLPLILGKFPAEEVRFWLMLNSFLVLSLLVEIGFTSTFGRLYAFAMAGKKSHELGLQGKNPASGEGNNGPNWETVQLLNQAGQRIFLILTLVYFLLLIGFGSWVVQDVVEGLQNPTHGWAAWIVMAISQPFAFLGKKYGCYLSGTGLIAINQRFTAVVSLLSAVAMVIALLFGGGIFTVILVGQLTALGSLFRARFLAVRTRPGRYRDSWFGGFSSEVWKVAWPSSWKSAIGQISLTGTTHLTVILFSKGVNPVEGAAYLLTLRLISTISQIANAPFYSKLPFLGRLRGAGDLSGLVKMAKRGMSLSSLVFVLGVLGLALVGPFLFEIFKKEVGFPPTDLWLAMGAAFSLQRFGAMHLQLYSTTNHIIWHWVGGITSVFLITLLAILIPEMGGMALPLSLALAYGLIFSPWSALLSYRSMRLNPWAFEKVVSAPSIALLTLGGFLILHYPLS